MKTPQLTSITCFTLLCSTFSLSLHAQSTAFTYQGRLNDGGNPANGIYDLRFGVYDAATAGNQQGTLVTNSATAVSNGLFTVTLDFGNQFPGAPRWLEVAARTNGAASFIGLTPRQKLTPAPYAITASNVTGVVGSGSLAGTYSSAVTLNNAGNNFTGNGAGLAALNASQLTAGQVPSAVLSNAWKLGGNTGTTPGANFVGTTDNEPLEFRVNGGTAFRLKPAPFYGPSIMGGSNTVLDAVSASVISGGFSNQIENTFSAISGGYINLVQGNACTVGGGALNTVGQTAYDSTIAGGSENQLDNTINSAILSGQQNSLGNSSGQMVNSSTIVGGQFNNIVTNVNNSTIGAGNHNSIGSSTNSVIAGGASNTVGPAANASTIAGGEQNLIQSDDGFVGGGFANIIFSNAFRSTIGGGLFNQVQVGAQYGFIGGGDNSSVGTNASFSSIVGGSNNTIDSNAQYSVIAGGQLNDVAPNGQFSAIGGGKANTIGASAYYATVPGGGGNTASGNFSTVVGGEYNAAGGFAASAGGGYSNNATGDYSFAAGQKANALHTGAFVWADSSAGVFSSTVPNQFSVRATGGISLVTSGAGLTLDGPATLGSDIQMGTGSSPYHHLSLSGGNSAGFLYGSYNKYGDGVHLGYNYYADAAGLSHIINTGGGTSRISVGYGSIIMATGGVDVQPNFENVQINTTSVTVNGTFNNNSDRNAKQDFEPVNPSEILEKVARLSVSEWSYKTDTTTRHLGPMAQDFHAAFEIGTDDKHIAPIDEGGVALAAIQGLNQKLNEKDSEIQKLQEQNTTLEKRLDHLEQTIKLLSEKN